MRSNRAISRCTALAALAAAALCTTQARADVDADGVLDPLDNCVHAPNPLQTDTGGLLSTSPDGVGTACQCGDGSDDGSVLVDDSADLRSALAAGAVLAAAHKCNVRGPVQVADGDGNGLRDDCSIVDAVVLRRALAGLGPGLDPACEPAQPGPPLPGVLQILAPLQAASEPANPVHFDIYHGGSVELGSLRTTLIGPGGPRDISSHFQHLAGLTSAQITIYTPGPYTLDVSAEDELGASLAASADFTLEPLADLELVGGTIAAEPELPTLNQSFQVHYHAVNQGRAPAPAGTQVEVRYEPLPGDPFPPMVLPPGALPELQPGAHAPGEQSFPGGIEGDGDLFVALDPPDVLPEGDESNNQDQEGVRPGQSSWQDLALRVESFDFVGPGQVDFEVTVKNVGQTVVQNAKLRYLVRAIVPDPADPDDRSLATLGDFLVLAGGEAGFCKGNEFEFHPSIQLLGALQPGESVRLPYTAFWSPSDPNATGWYAFCVEAIASGTPTVSWAPVLPETDHQGDATQGTANNSEVVEWDVRTIPPYPADGELRLGAVALSDRRAGIAGVTLDLVLDNATAPDYGDVEVTLSWRALGGRDGEADGPPLAATGTPVAATLISPRTTLRGLALPAAGAGPATLPYTPALIVTVSVTTDVAGSPVEILRGQRVLELDYTDFELDYVSTHPPEAHLHPVTGAVPPIRSTLAVRNRGAEPITVDLNLQQPQTVALPVSGGGSNQLTVAGGATRYVSFDWSPTATGSYTLYGSLSNVPGESTGLPADNTLQRTVDVLAPPDVYAYDLIATPSSGTQLEIGTQAQIEIRLNARNVPPSGFTFDAAVTANLAGSVQTIFSQSGLQVFTDGVHTLAFNWTPSRAGYQVFEVRIDAVPTHVQRMDVLPQVTTLAFSELDDVEIGGDGYSIEGGSWYELKAYASPHKLLDADDESIAGARLLPFTIATGLADDASVLGTLTFRVRYRGAVQGGGVAISDFDYNAGIGVGLKQRAGTGTQRARIGCWDPTDADCGILMHRDLWAVKNGGGTAWDYIEQKNREILAENLETLAELAFGPRAGHVVAVVVEVVTDLIDTANCDHNVEAEALIEFTLPLQNGDYDAYILMEGEVEVINGVGVRWGYVDFMGTSGRNCGGSRTGIDIDLESVSIYRFPEEYFGQPDGG